MAKVSTARLIAYAAAGFSAASAATFGAEHSVGIWKQFLAAGAMCICAFVAVHCMAWASARWRDGSRGWSILTGAGGLICFLMTLAFSTGMWASRADNEVAERSAAIDSGRVLRAERDRLNSERATLSRRPRGTIEAEISTAKTSPLYARSDKCEPETTTSRASREHCDTFRKLQGELAGVVRVEAIDVRVAEISGRLIVLPNVKAADAQAEAISRLLSISVDNAATLVAFGTSLALELAAVIAALTAEIQAGKRQPVAVASVKHARRRVWRPVAKPVDLGGLAAPVSVPAIERKVALPIPSKTFSAPAVVAFPSPAARRAKLGAAIQTGNVVQYLLGVLMPAPGERVDVAELLKGYRVWCDRRGLRPVTDEAFAETFAEAVKKAGLECKMDGVTIYCLNAKLVA